MSHFMYDSPAAWTAAELDADKRWLFALDDKARRDLLAAVRKAQSLGQVAEAVKDCLLAGLTEAARVTISMLQGAAAATRHRVRPGWPGTATGGQERSSPTTPQSMKVWTPRSAAISRPSKPIPAIPQQG